MKIRVLLIFAAVAAVTSLPYAYGFLSAGPDTIYTGLMYDVPDHAQYWSWVTASRDGLFISNTMTPEANPPIFLNPMMWALARVQVAFGLSFAALFQCWRLLATIVLVAALVAFLQALVPDAAQRRTALWLSLLGAGFGWVLVAAKVALHLPDAPFPTDLYTVEPNTFWGLLAYPYIALAQGLLLLSVLAVWRAHRRPGVASCLLAGVASLGLAVVHAYDLITLYAAIALFACALLVRDRRLPRALIGAGVMVAVFSAPMAFYFRSLTAYDPLWRSILAQYANAGVWTPRHVHLVTLMGLPLVLAAVALFRRGRRSDETLLVSSWAAAGLCLIYLPVVFQIKMLSGWQFPLAVLAAQTWHGLIAPYFARALRPWVRERAASAVALAVLAGLVVPTNLYLYAWRFIDLRRHTSPFYLQKDEAAALDWLAAHHTPSDVVLAPESIGRFVPNYGGTRAYLAHWAMTNRYYERVDNVRTFFTPGTADGWRTELARREGVTMVLRAGNVPGLAEQFDPGVSPAWEPVFVRPEAQIFRRRAVEAPAIPGDAQPGGGRGQ